MMKMMKIISIITSTIVFTGCGSSSSDSSTTDTTPRSAEQILEGKKFFTDRALTNTALNDPKGYFTERYSNNKVFETEFSEEDIVLEEINDIVTIFNGQEVNYNIDGGGANFNCIVIDQGKVVKLTCDNGREPFIFAKNKEDIVRL